MQNQQHLFRGTSVIIVVSLFMVSCYKKKEDIIVQSFTCAQVFAAFCNSTTENKLTIVFFFPLKTFAKDSPTR